MNKFLWIAALNIIVLIIFLLFLEFALRLFWQMSALKVKEDIYRSSSNRILRYELKPAIKTQYGGNEISINSDGFRGPEYKTFKDKDTYRIVVIGDSSAFGKLLSFEAALPYRLQAALSRLCPRKKIEVLNMGIEGYNSAQELELLRVKGLKYSPDLVIVYYNFNDPDYPEYYFKKNFINRHLLLAKYIQYRAKKYMVKKDRIRRGIRSISEDFQYLYSTQCWQEAKEAVLEMGDLTASSGIRMVLLVVPEMSEPVKDFREGYPFWYINKLIEKDIRHQNIIVIQPVEEFSKRNLNKDEFVAWSYPNSQANDIIAEYTIQKLNENRIDYCN